jgi:hypothetical protein
MAKKTKSLKKKDKVTFEGEAGDFKVVFATGAAQIVKQPDGSHHIKAVPHPMRPAVASQCGALTFQNGAWTCGTGSCPQDCDVNQNDNGTMWCGCLT